MPTIFGLYLDLHAQIKMAFGISEYHNPRLEGIHFQSEIQQVWTLVTGIWSSLSAFQMGNAFIGCEMSSLTNEV